MLEVRRRFWAAAKSTLVVVVVVVVVDVYYYIGERLKLVGETENRGICTKEQEGMTTMTAVVLKGPFPQQ